jgi:hypothetical protein
LLKDFGIVDPFSSLHSRFIRHHKAPVPNDFVASTLQNVVDNRNRVAHGGASLSISRADLGSWVRFLRSFGRAADNVLRDHTLSLIRALQ